MARLARGSLVGCVLAVLAVAVSFWLSKSVALAGTDDPARVKALIIGVPEYKGLGKDYALPRADNDASGLAEALVKELKVPAANVKRLEPGMTDRKSIMSAWTAHLRSLRPHDVSIFFFSGHGVEQDKEPFLLPSDYDRSKSGGSSGISMVELVSQFKEASPRALGIFVIDACRKEIGGSGGKFTESGESFAPVRAPEGTFIYYAASSNQIALHDLGQGDVDAYSVYTRVLLPIIRDRNLGLHEIAKDVRWETYQLALQRKTADGTPIQHKQVPDYFDDVLERLNILGTPLERPARKAPEKSLAPGKLAGVKGFFWACKTCPEMVEIPPPPGAASGKGVAIGRFEVTRDEWRVCVEAGRCRAVDDDIIEGDRRPITGVTFDDAQAFVAWLNETLETKGFRLPTVAEWEHAARGGSTSGLDFGPARDASQLCDYANGADASLKTMVWANTACNDGKARTVASAGSYRPNAYGAYDMQGNVWEWVADCYAPGGAGAGDAKGCDHRIAKGGSWRSGPDALKIGAFQAFAHDTARATLGFRIARDLD